MKELQKYYTNDGRLYDQDGSPVSGNDGNEFYDSDLADAHIAALNTEIERLRDHIGDQCEVLYSLKQQHAEVVDILEKRIANMREHGAFIDRKYAEEIERLKAELGIYRESLQMREGELCVCAGTIRDLRKQAGRYEKDSKRFDYWFGSRKGGFDMDGYMKGMRQGWSVDQWRAFVDSQIGVDQLPASGEA